jgi:hypothetical protein
MGSHKLINQEIQKQYSVWITTAWKRISTGMNVKGVRWCCISNAVDRTDDGMLWNYNEKVGNVRSKCEEDEGNDGEDGEDGDSDTDR